MARWNGLGELIMEMPVPYFAISTSVW